VTTGVVTTSVVTTSVVTRDVVTTGVVTAGVVTRGVVTRGVVTRGIVTRGVVTTGVVTRQVPAFCHVLGGDVTATQARGIVTGGIVTGGIVTGGIVTGGIVTGGDAIHRVGDALQVQAVHACTPPSATRISVMSARSVTARRADISDVCEISDGSESRYQ
jgi:hypothetical protein